MSEMKKAAKQRANEFLQPVIDDVNGPDSYGAKSELTEDLENVTGEPVGRHKIERWLHPDPERRVQPGLGSGLLLVETWKKKRKTKRNKQ